MKKSWINTGIAGIMLFITIGIIFTPHLPFSDQPLVQKGIEYAVHGMLGLLAFSLLLFVLGQHRLMFIGMACVAAICIFLKNASNTHLLLPSDKLAPEIKVAHFNLSYIDEGYEAFVKRLKNMDVDLISLQELTPDWDAEIGGQLLKLYPHTSRNVRIDPYGMGIFSKNVLLRRDTFHVKEVPYMHTSLKLGDEIINILSTYLLPPLNKSGSLLVKEQLASVTRKIKSLRKPCIVIGDFNMVYWSNEIRTFRENADLHNSRRGFTPLGFKIPYDHIFFTDQLECSQFEEILDKNSKHLGILGTFQFKNTTVTDDNQVQIGGSK